MMKLPFEAEVGIGVGVGMGEGIAVNVEWGILAGVFRAGTPADLANTKKNARQMNRPTANNNHTLGKFFPIQIL